MHAGVRRRTDTVAVSEKVAVLLTHRAVLRSAVSSGRLARVLARNVRTVGDSRGLSIPERMQLVLQRQGRLRVLPAAASAGVLCSWLPSMSPATSAVDRANR